MPCAKCDAAVYIDMCSIHASVQTLSIQLLYEGDLVIIQENFAKVVHESLAHGRSEAEA